MWGMITFNIKPDRASTKTPCSSLDLGLCLGPGSGLDQGSKLRYELESMSLEVGGLAFRIQNGIHGDK